MIKTLGSEAVSILSSEEILQQMVSLRHLKATYFEEKKKAPS